MPKASRLILMVLVLGASACAVGIGLTILSNWFFRGEPGISGDQAARLVIFCLVLGCMPLALVWARSQKKQQAGRQERDRDATDSR